MVQDKQFFWVSRNDHGVRVLHTVQPWHNIERPRLPLDELALLNLELDDSVDLSPEELALARLPCFQGIV